MKQKAKWGIVMKIHTVTMGESLSEISKKYEIPEKLLMADNEITRGVLAVGEELLVRQPTRTHRARYRDTLDSLCIRYGIKKSDILAQNPHIKSGAPDVGEYVVLRQPEKPYGNAASNGYFYSGCSEEAFLRALPYLTYVTFSSAILGDRRCEMSFSTKIPAKRAEAEGCIPLLRFHTKRGTKISASAIESILRTTSEAGCCGAVIPMQGKGKEYKETLSEFRARLSKEGILLIIECDEESATELSREADLTFFSYCKHALDVRPSFEEGEHLLLSRVAGDGAANRTLVELPATARCADSFIGICEAISGARKSRAEIKKDRGLMCEFSVGQKRYVYPSLENIKANLELVGELGFMGVSFDIMRSPTSHFLAFNDLYKPIKLQQLNSQAERNREL